MKSIDPMLPNRISWLFSKRPGNRPRFLDIVLKIYEYVFRQQVVILFLIVVSMTPEQVEGYFGAVNFWDPGGVPVTTATGHQLQRAITTDGVSGAILTWRDSRNSSFDIYAQRIDSRGITQWTEGGIPLAAAANNQDYPAITSDTQGGAIVAFEDSRTLQRDIYAQRVDANGVIQWQADGVPIGTNCWNGVCANQKGKPQLDVDGAGGAIITWYEIRNGFNFSVWAQRVLANGTVDWATDGVPVAFGLFNADFPKIVSDGSSGAVIVWQDGRDAQYRIFAQRLNSEGTPLWTVNGVQVSDGIALRGSRGHAIVSNGSGGVIIVWVASSGVSSNADLYAQKLDANGQEQWQSGGIPISIALGHQYDPSIVADGAGGAFIAWEHQTAGSGTWIYAQKINSAGIAEWNTNGIPVYSHHSASPKILQDGSDGSIILYGGSPDGPSLFAQRLNTAGVKLWGPDGHEIYNQPGGNYWFGPVAISNGGTETIVSWTDYRDASTSWDIYAQKTGELPESTVVTRNLAAIGLLRAKYGIDFTPEPATGIPFDDVEADDYAADYIERLKTELITEGCDTNNYCPYQVLTKDQLAILLLKAKYGSAFTPPPATGLVFDDVAIDDFAAAWIEELHAETIAELCDVTRYCPKEVVTIGVFKNMAEKTFP